MRLLVAVCAFPEIGGDFSQVAGRLVWCLRNNDTFVALKLAWGEARGRECIRSDTRPTEQRSLRPISAQPEGRHVFWAEALLLAPHRSTSGYALVPVRKHLAPSLRPKSIARMYSYFGDTTPGFNACPAPAQEGKDHTERALSAPIKGPLRQSRNPNYFEDAS